MSWHWTPNIPLPQNRKIQTNDTMKIPEASRQITTSLPRTRLMSFQDQVNVCIAQRGLVAPRAASRCNEINYKSSVCLPRNRKYNEISRLGKILQQRRRTPKFQSLYIPITFSCQDVLMPHPCQYLQDCSSRVYISWDRATQELRQCELHIQQPGVRTP